MGTEFKKGLQRPSLLACVRGILDLYPDDGQILKELIQNADDAGADTVRFLLDERTRDDHGGKYSHPGLAKFQGAALYAYNDAAFTEDDWMGICKMHESMKRKDPIKTGRFGLGFKSIFHVTDLPVILSGDYVGFIDPHELYLPDNTSAHAWHLANDSQEIRNFWSQFQPLSHTLFDSRTFQKDQYYGHTLFRFPLRASASKLSTKIYSCREIDQLLNSLVVEEGQSLLFLKSVSTIEIYKHRRSESEAVLIHRASISQTHKESIKVKRSSFLKEIQSCEFWGKKPLNVMYSMAIDVLNNCDGGDMVIDVLNNCPGGAVGKRHGWMVGHSCGTDGLDYVEELVEELGVLPWVGVALPLPGSDTYDQVSSSTCGRLFASLPLPLDGTEDTGLPFQIHGFFDMVHNRRHLKWQTSGQRMTKRRDPSLIWNQVLVCHLVPSAVLAFLTALIHDHTHGEGALGWEEVYAAMPDGDKVDRKWQPVVAYLYPRLFNESSLYSPVDSGRWLSPGACFMLDEGMKVERRRVVEGILLGAGRPLVIPPPHVVKALTCYSETPPTKVTPDSVKNDILNNTKTNLPRSSALILLKYFWEYFRIPDLVGLPLIPLLDREMAVFKDTHENNVYVTSVDHPSTLLPRLEGRLVDTDLDELTNNILIQIAKSGKTQLAMLGPSSVLDLLPEVGPPSCLEEDVVLLETGVHTRGWVKDVWNYLQTYGTVNMDYQKLRKLHLLPVGHSELRTLDSGRRMVLKKAEVPDSVYGFLAELDVVVLYDAPDYVHRNEFLTRSFLQPCTLQGMINALKICEENNKSSLAEMIRSLWQKSDHLVEGFLSYICDSGVELLSSSSKDFLKRLPIFKTVNGSGFSQSAYVSLTEVPFSAPLVTLPVNFPSRVIEITNKPVRCLVETLGIHDFHSWDLTTVVKEKLIPEIHGGKYTAENVKSIALLYLDHFESYFKGDQDLVLQVGNSRCIQGVTGRMKTPPDFFDPTEPLLQDLLGEDCFPEELYGTPGRLVALRSVGLRSLKSLQPSEVLRLAQSVRTNSGKNTSFLSLVKHLSKQREYVENTRFWQELSLFPFLPVVQHRPSYYPPSMPWYGESTASFLSVVGVCHVGKAKVLGGVFPLVDIEPRLLELLQSHRLEPGVECLVHQMKLVKENYRPAEKAKYILLVDELYTKLSQYNAGSVKEALTNQSLSDWVWSGEEFRALDRMLLSTNRFDFSPHVSVLPPEMEKHRELFKSCGMTEDINPAQVLAWISEANENRDRSIQEVQKDLQLSIHILKSLPPGSSRDVLVPLKTDNPFNLGFCPASECTRKTASDALSLLTDLKGVKYVHPSVPWEVCDALSIRSDVSRGANSEALGMEACGQTEPLTRRLHSILEGYTDGLAFITEMIQNADDAGATEVRLIYDKRKNEENCGSIFSPAMKAWQGPAFWVYNDATFSDDDFRNIAKLNGATKKEMVEKIGTFGLGFNAVYNVTDVPSFLSGEHMVIFDPHTTYLNDALVDKAMPGIKFRVTNSKTNILHCFSDHFAPWNGVCQCNLKPDAEALFDGSLFRLPFRGQTESYFSKISNTAYTEHDVQMLLDIIQNQGNKILLFTQNVVKFSVSLIPEDTVDVENGVHQLFHIRKEPVSYVKKHGVRIEVPPKGQKEFLTETSILKAAKACRTVSLKSTLMMKTMMTYNTDGMGLLGSSCFTDEENLWLVSNCSEPSDVTHHQLVVSGTAIQLTKTDAGLAVKPLFNSKNDPCGSYFSFLPLPVECGLPFHVNGLFSLDYSRRHLLTKTEHDRDSPGGKWNQTLIQDAVCPTVIYSLREAVQVLSQESDVYSLLPVRTEEILARKLTQTFWKAMISDPDAPPILKGSQEWVTPQNAGFLEKATFNSKEVLLDATKIVVSEYLAGLGLTYVDVPSEILDILWATDEKFMKKKTITEERFFIDCFLPNVADLPISTEQRDRLLLYGLMMSSRDVNSAYCLLPCIPVSELDHQFLLPNELIHPRGRAAKLYDVEDLKFPCFSVGNERNLPFEYDKLCQFGMVKDILKWEDILERAEDIAQNLSANDVGRAKLLIEYLEWRLHCRTDAVPEAGIKMSLSLVRFIPVMQRPGEWTLAWKGDFHSLCCGCEMLFNDKYLVGCADYAIPNKSLGISRDVALFLNMKMAVPLNDTVQQLQAIADRNQSPQTALMIQSIKMIYTYLDELCQSPSDAQTIASMMSDKRLVYIGGEDVFVSPDQCAFGLEFQASPFLYSLSLTHFQNFYRTIGVKEQFLPQDYIEVLSRIKTGAGEEPLGEDMLDKVVKILQQLKKEMQDQELTLAMLRKHGQIYLPDTKAVLYQSGKMTYLDCPWVKGELPYLMTSKRISYDIAKALGAKDIRSQLLSRQSQKLGTPFGQKEILIDRIRTVLKAYPFGTQILMEFAQNADDAGATELHFILDRRTHGQLRLIGDKWRSLQGPGLCVYNNARFTNADLNGIIALGQGSKKDNPGKIGQHGIGLSAVYHITDVQIIRVQMEDGTERLIALDPTCQYVPGATSAEPGMLYSQLDGLRNIFPDVFSCFLEDKYKDGTFFRLPLHQKNSTRISDSFRDIAETDALLDTMKAACVEALLFLTSLREIHISRISEAGSVSTESITANAVQDQNNALQTFKDAVNNAAKKYAESGRKLSAIPHMQVSYTVEIRSATSAESWNVVQQLGTKEDIPEDVVNSFSVGKIPALPVGGAAYLCSETMSPSSPDQEVKPKEGIVYASLPLPLKTSLPVNLNGHFMLDHESRQHLWGGRGDDYKTQWNEFLCGNVIAPCYTACILMEQRKLQEYLVSGVGTVSRRMSDYIRMFPQDHSTQHCHESKIVENTCKLIGKLDLIPVPLLHLSEVRWGSLVGDNPVYFYQHKDLPPLYSHEGDDTEPSHLPLVVKVADLCSIKGANFPKSQVQVFEKHLSIKFITPSTIVEVLRDRYRTSNTIPRLHIEDVHKVLEYCMTDPAFHESVESLPLLVTSDGKLGVFSASHPVFNSPYIDLVAPSSGEFLHPSFIHSFKDVESDVFKDFEIADFAQHLAQSHADLVCGNDDSVKYDEGTISKEALDRVWEFIRAKSKSGHDIRPVYDLCLLKVRKGGPVPEERLYPLKLAYTIIAEHDSSFQSGDIIPWLKEWNLVADWDDPSSIAKAFLYYQTKGTRSNSRRAADLLSYFSAQKNVGKLSSEALEDVKHLEIFPTIDSKYSNGTGTVYVVPTDIPGNDMDTWVQSDQLVFLKETKNFECLYQKLEFYFWTNVELYTNCIIPKLERGFSEKGYWEHMKYIVRQFRKKTSVLDRLNNASVVLSTDGTLRKASELFAPSIKLFQQMEGEGSFPKTPPLTCLNPAEWEDFLTLIGLVCEVSSDKMFTYVCTLSHNSKTKIEQRNLSKEVLDYISCLPAKVGRVFLKKISHVFFMPQETTTAQLTICPPSTPRELVRLRGSVVGGVFADLVWSVAPVIPHWFTSNRWKEISRAADIITKPSCHLVVRHLKRVCLYQAPDPPECADKAEFFENVLKECFKFIEKELPNCDDEVREVIATLSESACIFVQKERKMIRPTFSFLESDDSDEVGPYLFKVPDYMKRFRSTLELVGCASKPSSRHYQAVLQQIFDEHGTELLEKQKLDAAKSSMDKIFLSNAVDIDLEKPLYLLSEEGRLIEGKNLVLNNNSTIRKRLFPESNMECLAKIATNLPVELLLNKFPETHRPQTLTSRVKEVMCDITRVAGCIQKAAEIERNLHSRAIINGVQRMAVHIASHEGRNQNADFFVTFTRQICSILQKIKIVPVTRLQTAITDGYGRQCGGVYENPIYIDESTSSMYVHINVLQNQTWQDGMYFWMLLVEMIDRHMQGLFKEYKHKLMVILAADEAKVEQLLDSMGIAN